MLRWANMAASNRGRVMPDQPSGKPTGHVATQVDEILVPSGELAHWVSELGKRGRLLRIPNRPTGESESGLNLLGSPGWTHSRVE